MGNGGAAQKFESAVEYKDDAGSAGYHFPLDNEFPYGIIAIEKVPNGNEWPLKSFNRLTAKLYEGRRFFC